MSYSPLLIFLLYLYLDHNSNTPRAIGLKLCRWIVLHSEELQCIRTVTLQYLFWVVSHCWFPCLFFVWSIIMLLVARSQRFFFVICMPFSDKYVMQIKSIYCIGLSLTNCLFGEHHPSTTVSCYDFCHNWWTFIVLFCLFREFTVSTRVL